MGAMDRLLTAGPDVHELGLAFHSLPPGDVRVHRVVEGSWAAAQGVEVDQEVVSINGQQAAAMTREQFMQAMRVRPLKVAVRLPVATPHKAEPPPPASAPQQSGAELAEAPPGVGAPGPDAAAAAPPPAAVAPPPAAVQAPPPPDAAPSTATPRKARAKAAEAGGAGRQQQGAGANRKVAEQPAAAEKEKAKPEPPASTGKVSAEEHAEPHHGSGKRRHRSHPKGKAHQKAGVGAEAEAAKGPRKRELDGFAVADGAEPPAAAAEPAVGPPKAGLAEAAAADEAPLEAAPGATDEAAPRQEAAERAEPVAAEVAAEVVAGAAADGREEELQLRLPAPPPSAVVIAGEEVACLGLSFHALPPGPVHVRQVAAGSWASAQGLREGDEVLKVNGRAAAAHGREDFIAALAVRPLTLEIQHLDAGAWQRAASASEAGWGAFAGVAVARGAQAPALLAMWRGGGGSGELSPVASGGASEKEKSPGSAKAEQVE